MTRRLWLTLSVCALGLQGCGLGLGHRPVVENRYLRAKFEPVETTDAKVDYSISVATAAVPDRTSALPFTSLSDRAQAAFIVEMKGKAPPLEFKGDGDGDEKRIAFQSALKRRFVISVRPIAAFLRPGDRLESVSIWLKVAEPHVSFWRITNWSQASNDSQTIELGSIQRTEGSKLTVGGGLEATSGSIGETKVGLERSVQNQETGKVVDETKLSAGVQNGVAWLTQRGGARRDLSGNYEIDTTISVVDENYYPVMATKASKLIVEDQAKPGKQRETRAGEVDLTVYTVYAAKLPDQPICGKATLLYRVRQIEDGDATLSESDDKVLFKSGAAEADFVIAPPTVLPRFGLTIDGDFIAYLVKGKPVTLTFASLQEAEAFSDWLSRRNPKDGKLHNTTIGLPTPGAAEKMRPLTSSQALRAMAELQNREEIAKSHALMARGCPAAVSD